MTTFHQSAHLLSGERVSGHWRGLDDGAIVLQPLWGGELRIALDKLEKITMRNGRLLYLTDLAPAAVEMVPYFDRVWPHRINTSLGGKPLQLIDAKPARGIAVHSRTVLHYDIAGPYERFRSKLGFQQPEGKQGNVDVRVLGDGKTLFEQRGVRGDQPSIDIDVAITGVSRLSLEVDFGEHHDVADRVVWADPRLLRNIQQP